MYGCDRMASEVEPLAISPQQIASAQAGNFSGFKAESAVSERPEP
jgi:hypothetical protein